jgi:Flp pilus assembly protein TadG
MIRRLIRSDTGSTAAEFGMVLPLLIMFLLGTIDVGRFLWTCNRAEKAVQMGTRYAVATNMVPAGLASYDFATPNVADTVLQGNPVPAAAFGSASCQLVNGTVTCTCSGTTCSKQSGTVSTTAFNNVVARMQAFYPGLSASNVVVTYDNVGLGYSGDPNGSDVAPLVTVKLTNLTFAPMLFSFFQNATVSLPTFSSALTMEDGIGNSAE